MYLTPDQLSKLGLRSCGQNVQISDRASIYGASRISIGDNVRIDDFAVLSAGDGGITLGNRVHVSVGAKIIGAGEVTVGDCSNISLGATVLSSSGDLDHLNGACITTPHTKIEPVVIGRGCSLLTNSIVLPGTMLLDGSILGALSMANGVTLSEDTIYGGCPCRVISRRPSAWRDEIGVEN